MNPAARSARARTSGETRERILSAASALVARNGYAGTSISMICREARVNASSLYWLFPSKEHLFLTVIEAGASDFLEVMALPTAGRPSASEAVATIAHLLAEKALFLRILMVMMLESQSLSPDFRARLAEIRARSLDWWRALLEHMFAPLGSTGARFLATDLALLCRSTVNGAFIAAQFGEPVSVEAVMRQLLQLIECLVARIAAEHSSSAAVSQA
jgi:AcrR family transcriptional regulator